ncbi:ABC transporter ATP-binding protein [Aeromicrobium sp.]|uniref:ABC transporter ATP-binding protein n=1 Tax=Aeromicrobium sp. TaxID=1871063 RepID=UPI002FCBDC90
MGAEIRADGLVMTYGDVRAVDGVSFTVAPGEFFGLLGPNGAGKTTTLEMVEGLRKPQAGSVRIDQYEPWKREPALQRRMGVQLQSSSFFERLTAREQLDTFGALYGVAAGRTDEMLEQVGLVDKADVRTEDLSGGQKQRLSIACALIHDPDVVFLDEPTAALDPQARRNLWDVLRSINDSGRTVILTTHYLDEAEALCDRVAIMDSGKILELDTPAALIRGLDAPVRISLAPGTLDVGVARDIANGDAVTHEPEVDGDGALTITTRDPSRILTELARRDALAGLSVKGASLEDVFLELTGREYRA